MKKNKRDILKICWGIAALCALLCSIIYCLSTNIAMGICWAVISIMHLINLYLEVKYTEEEQKEW